MVRGKVIVGKKIIIDGNTPNCCPLCNSNNVLLAYSTYDRHYGIKGNFDVAQCKDCLLQFINPMLTEEELTNLYPQDTFYAYQDFEKKSNYGYKKILKKLFKRILFVDIHTKDPEFHKPGKVLDIGCGSGSFLYEWKQKGWETRGIEVNLSAAQLGNKIAGLNILACSLINANFEVDSFDYVRLNHSFEHVTNPNEVLAEIHKILKKDGKLFIGVPNIQSFNALFFKKYWWGLAIPVHVFGYSVKNLSELLIKHHFVVESVNYNSNYSGILGSIQIFLNRKNGKLSTDGYIVGNTFLKAPAQYLARLQDLLRLGDSIEIICRKE
jgi:SAM-dependent methyltransferase